MFAAAALLGCAKEPIPATPSEQPGAIAFDNVTTRAGKTDLEADGFGVWACVSSKDDAHSVQYEPLLGSADGAEKVTWTGSEWTYVNTEYWITNSYFYFFAAYPENLFTQSRVEIQNNNFTAYTADITANGGADTQDILVATAVTDTTVEGYDETVQLQFGHLLSKVNVKVRQNFDADPDFNYYVTKVTITGVKGNGTFAVLPYVDNFMSAWNFENAETITLEKDFSSDPVLLRNIGAADPTVTLTVWDDGLMLIPQELPGGNIAVRVDYLYDVNLEDDDMGTPKFVEGFVPAGAWESGKSVSYTLAIANSSFITFEQPTIDPWGAPQTGGTIIIQ